MKAVLATLGFLVGFAFGVTFYSSAANAGFFNDVVDAITGHATDIKDRILVDEVTVDGITITSNTFRKDDPGRDGIHWANGTVSIIDSGDGLFIQLGSDFEAGLAPDLYVYIADRKVTDEADFANADVVEVGKLARGKGASAYELTEEFDGHIEVIIWCKRFGEFISATTLEIK